METSQMPTIVPVSSRIGLAAWSAQISLSPPSSLVRTRCSPKAILSPVMTRRSAGSQECLEDGSTESDGMKAAEKAGISVVVEKDRLPAPLDGCRKAAGQHYLDSRFQALRPRQDGAERRRRPVKGTDAIGHFAPAVGPR